MRIKIVSDGTTAGTKVTDEEGRVVENVTEVAWFADAADGGVFATLVIANVLADIVTNSEVEH